MKYININNLSYKINNNIIFKNTSIKINKGEFVCILGKNSSGKTTLLDIIKNTNNEKTNIINYSTASYSKTILDDLSLITNINIDVKKLLKDFGLYNKINKSIHNLSYYDNQKYNIIKSILSNFKIILLDSILIPLNIHEKIELLSLIKKYQMELNLTIIYTTVNLDEVMFCDRVFIINDKKIYEENIENIYDSDLIKKASINIPLFHELKSKLKLYDLIDDNVGTIEEMVDEICR